MALRMKSMVLMAFAAIAFPLFGASYSYNGLTWTDSADPGQWTSRYADAKAYAKKFDIPLVVVWANPPCGYCKTFESSVGGSGDVKKWMTSSKYVFVFALGTANNASYGLSNGDGSAAKSFAGRGLSKFPYIGVWWPKDKNGREVKQTFTGRSGYMPVKSGSLARQFMDSVDQLVGAYAGVAPKYLTVTFNANGGSVSPKTRLVANGKAVGTLPKPNERSGYIFSGWFTAKTGGTQITASTKVSGDVTYYAHWLKGVELNLSASPSAGGTVSGAGTYAEGSSVTVKAKAKSGYVFSCWKQGTKELSQSATYKHALGSSKTTLTASFVSKAQDLSSVSLKVDGSKQVAEKVVTNTVPQGVRLEWPVEASALTAATPSASGLPSGLKLVKDKATGLYSIKGTPTAASKKDKNGNVKPSNVTIKVKTAAGNTVPYRLAVVVAARPDWAVGTFNGVVLDGADPVGLVQTLTIAANGKISGKLLKDGKKWTMSSSSLSSMSVGSKNTTNFLATVIGKSGKETTTNDISVVAEAMPAAVGGTSPPFRGVVKTPELSGSKAFKLSCWQNLWKTEPWKTNAKKIAKAKPLPVPGVLGADFGDVALKFGANGAVTVKGGGASSSAVLIPSSEEPASFLLYFYLAPKKLFPGYAGVANLKWDGTNLSL